MYNLGNNRPVNTTVLLGYLQRLLQKEGNVVHTPQVCGVQQWIGCVRVRGTTRRGRLLSMPLDSRNLQREYLWEVVIVFIRSALSGFRLDRTTSYHLHSTPYQQRTLLLTKEGSLALF